MDAPNTYLCPKCGHSSRDMDQCEACGASFVKIRQRRIQGEMAEMSREDLPPLPHSELRDKLPLWQKTLVMGIILLIGVVWAFNRYGSPGAASGASGPEMISAALTPDGRPAVVKFYADWCGPCKVYAPIFDRVTADYGTRIKVASIDLDARRDLGQQFNVSAIPATLFFDGKGKLVGRAMGLQGEAALKRAIDAAF